MIRVLVILLGLTVFAGCDDSDDLDSIEHFRQHLKADMNYNSLIRTFGKPDDDVGSGIHIYIYHLTDGTKVQIGFTNKILYAKLVDRNDYLIDVLI
jgi:hypothetical protein